MRRILFALCLALGTLPLNGCFMLAAGAAGAAGVYAYQTNSLTARLEHPVKIAHPAAVAALSELELTLQVDQADQLSATMQALTAQSKQVRIEMTAVGETMTDLRIRVGTGFLGTEKDQALLIHRAILRHLP